MGDMRFVQLGVEEAMREGKGKKIEVASVWLYVDKNKIKLHEIKLVLYTCWVSLFRGPQSSINSPHKIIHYSDFFPFKTAILLIYFKFSINILAKHKKKRNCLNHLKKISY